MRKIIVAIVSILILTCMSSFDHKKNKMTAYNSQCYSSSLCVYNIICCVDLFWSNPYTIIFKEYPYKEYECYSKGDDSDVVEVGYWRIDADTIFLHPDFIYSINNDSCNFYTYEEEYGDIEDHVNYVFTKNSKLYGHFPKESIYMFFPDLTEFGENDYLSGDRLLLKMSGKKLQKVFGQEYPKDSIITD